MEAYKKLLVPVLIVAACGVLSSCERKITRIEQVPTQVTCFGCHSDTSTFLVAATQQWEHSRHASGGTLNENDGECKGCHTSEGFVARAGGTPVGNEVENPTSIHCFTCHAPHTNGDFRLRWTANAALLNGTTYNLHDGNTCVACHHSRRDVRSYVSGRPALTSRWGPHHSPQGDNLIGSNGYEYDGFTYERSNHRSVTNDGCLDCHFRTTTQNIVGGHSFNMEFEAEGDTTRNTAACARCHSGTIDDWGDVGDFSVPDSVETLVNTLKTKLVAANLLSSSGLPRSVTTSADSAGAVWNLLMVTEDRSEGIHNPKYMMGLLRSAIMYMDGDLPQSIMVFDRR